MSHPCELTLLNVPSSTNEKKTLGIFLVFNMKVLIVIWIVTSFWGGSIDSQRCKEGLFIWIIQLPANEIVSQRQTEARQIKANWQREEGSHVTNSNNLTENSSQSLCASSTSSTINFTCLSSFMNATLTRSSLKCLEDQYQSILSTFKTSVKGNLSICYPLSPQLLDCPLIYYEKNCYDVHQDTYLLHIFKTNYHLQQGDYFIDYQGRGSICSEPLLAPVNLPRCNYVALATGQYMILLNGSLYVNESNKLIQRPIYKTLTRKTLNVCYPLSIEFLK